MVKKFFFYKIDLHQTLGILRSETDLIFIAQRYQLSYTVHTEVTLSEGSGGDRSQARTKES